MLSLALARARVSVPTEPRFDCANVLRRTHCVVRRTSIYSERDLERSFVSHSNSKGARETGWRDARRDTTHDARRTTHDATADDYWCSRRPASGGTSSHARTQLRLASPARTHARTNETNTISQLDSPPNLRLFIVFPMLFIAFSMLFNPFSMLFNVVFNVFRYFSMLFNIFQ